MRPQVWIYEAFVVVTVLYLIEEYVLKPDEQKGSGNNKDNEVQRDEVQLLLIPWD